MQGKPRRADNVSVLEAAERLNVHQDTIRAGLISKQLPFGTAVQCKRNNSYIIPRERFEIWIAGRDLAQTSVLQNQVLKLILQKLDLMDLSDAKEKTADDTRNIANG